MDTLKVFENPAFGKIRALTLGGEPWFVGNDVAKALGYGDGKSCVNAVANHVDDEDKGVTEMMTPGGKQNIRIINESGLYSLILSSKLDSAKAFKRWVTAEVLPAIRKTGGYIAGAEKMTDAEIMAQAVLVANRTIEARDARIRELEAKAKADAPKVLYADAVAASEGGMLIREFAKFLRDNGVDMGEKRLFEDMRKRGFLIKAEGRDRNTPTQRAMDMGLFTVKETVIQIPLLGAKTRTTPLLTGKGKLYFMNLYLKERDAAPVAEAAT